MLLGGGAIDRTLQVEGHDTVFGCGVSEVCVPCELQRWSAASAVGHHDHPCPCACSISVFVRLCGWLVLLGRSSASTTPSCSCYGTRSPCCAGHIPGPARLGRPRGPRRAGSPPRTTAGVQEDPGRVAQARPPGPRVHDPPGPQSPECLVQLKTARSGAADVGFAITPDVWTGCRPDLLCEFGGPFAAGHVQPDVGPADGDINEPDHRLGQGLDERPLSSPVS